MESDIEELLAENIEWEGTATSAYRYAYGALRRLIMNPSVNFGKGVGVWSRNLDCEVVK